MDAIVVDGLEKRYREVEALAGVSFAVRAGETFALLGPNGAGKSTTMRMLTAQSIADEGELEVLGFQLPRDSKQARAQCGVVPQLDNLDVALGQLVDEVGVVALGVLDPHHVVEQQLVVVARREPAVGEAGCADQHLAEPADFGVHAVRRGDGVGHVVAFLLTIRW